MNSEKYVLVLDSASKELVEKLRGSFRVVKPKTAKLIEWALRYVIERCEDVEYEYVLAMTSSRNN